MNWRRIDPKWADPGRSGIACLDGDGGYYVIFTILDTTVNGADILVLDTNMDLVGYTPGNRMHFSWETELWQIVKEFE